MIYVRWERTPQGTGVFIKPYIEGKTVVDLGAGDGDFLREIQPYAKEVTGYEISDFDAPSYVKKKNFLDADLSEFEVIYCFLNSFAMYAVGKMIEDQSWHGILISLFYKLPDREPSETIDVKMRTARFPLHVYRL